MVKKAIILFLVVLTATIFLFLKNSEKNNSKYPYIEIPDKIEDVGKFSRGSFIIKKDGKYGLMRIDTTIIVEPVWDKIEKFNKHGYSVVKKGKHYGVINENQDIIIPIEYDLIKAAKYTKSFMICRKGKWGIADWQNNIVLPLEYNEISETKFGKYIVKKNRKYGVVSNFGNEIIPFEFGTLSQINKKTYIGFKERNKKYHLIGSDSDFTEARIDFSDKYDKILSFCPHMSIVKKGEDHYLLNLENYEMKIIGSGYKVIGEFVNQMAVIQDRNEKYGAINEEGDVVIEPKYEFLSLEENDLILFKEGKNYGYMDRFENIIIPAVFKEISPFEKDRAVFKIDGKEGVIDIKGQVAVLPEYIKVIAMRDNIYILKTEKGIGVFGKDEKEIIPAKYKDVTFFGRNNIRVLDKENVKIFDYTGKEIFSVKASEIKKEWKDNGQINLKKKIYLFN